MQRFQELAYPPGHNYRTQSPHLKHRHLYERLVVELRAVFKNVRVRGLPLTMLEIGAGDGAFVEPALAYGCRVTATEMSRASIAELNERYGANPGFEALFDGDGTLEVLGDAKFSVILFASVLHHIPDYLAAIENAISRHLIQGGALVSFQDPLWYPSLGRGTRFLNDVSYLTWRLTKGNYRRGLSTRLRRIRNHHDDLEPSDVVEYHVVRNGVDQGQIVEMLSRRFDGISVISYWSTPSGFWQGIGDRLGVKTTFATVAQGFTGFTQQPEI